MGYFNRKKPAPAEEPVDQLAKETTQAHSETTSLPDQDFEKTGELENTPITPRSTSPAPDVSLKVTENKSEDVDLKAKDEGEDEDEANYPRAMKLVLITLALCLAVFCVALDNTIISTAIPRITDQFKSINDVGWYASAYLLTTCAFQLLFGKFYTFFSIKWVFLTAIVIFEIGSAICGAAPNSVALIIGRAIAGLGSAGIFSGGILIIANTVPLRKRPIYTALIGGM